MSTPLSDLLSLYRLHHPDVSANSMQQYEIAIGQFTAWLGREAIIADLTSEQVGAFMIHLKDSGNRSARTINNKRQFLAMLAKFALGEDLLDRPVTTRKLREEEKIPNAFSVDQMRRILEACRRAPVLPLRLYKKHTNRWFPDHWEILIRAIWETGHRLNALLKCPRAAVRACVLTMPASLTKSKREQRHRLSAELVGLIDDLRPRNELLLPWPLHPRQIWYMLDQHIMTPAGIEKDRRNKFHCLRRTSVSHLLRATGDARVASQHLGHTDFKVTQRYIDPSIAYQEITAADVLPGLG